MMMPTVMLQARRSAMPAAKKMKDRSDDAVMDEVQCSSSGLVT